jgi:hypothetical protein
MLFFKVLSGGLSDPDAISRLHNVRLHDNTLHLNFGAE